MQYCSSGNLINSKNKWQNFPLSEELFFSLCGLKSPFKRMNPLCISIYRERLGHLESKHNVIFWSSLVVWRWFHSG